jgi:hypothetical protein
MNKPGGSYTKVRLSDCAMHYATALMNPFVILNGDVCIPDMIAVPSQKLRVRSEGTMTVGSSGVGWVAFNPWYAIANNGVNTSSTLTAPVVFTLGAYSAADYTMSLPIGTTNGIGQSNSIYNSANFTTSDTVDYYRAYRLVAAGLKVTYIGDNFNNAGRVVLVRWPDNFPGNGIPADGSMNGSALLSIPQSGWAPAGSRRDHSVCYSPLTPVDFEYQGYGSYISHPTVANYQLLAYIDGGSTAVQQAFGFEAIAYYEIIGGTVPTTISSCDPVAMGNVVSKIPATVPLDPPATNARNLIAETIRGIAETTSAVVEAAPGAFGAIAKVVHAGAHLATGTRHRDVLSFMSGSPLTIKGS